MLGGGAVWQYDLAAIFTTAFGKPLALSNKCMSAICHACGNGNNSTLPPDCLDMAVTHHAAPPLLPPSCHRPCPCCCPCR